MIITRKACLWRECPDSDVYFLQLENYNVDEVKDLIVNEHWSLFANTHSKNSQEFFVLKKSFKEEPEEVESYCLKNQIELLDD